MKLTINIEIPKEYVQLLKKYDYDFENACTAQILYDWQETFLAEEDQRRKKLILNKTYGVGTLTTLTAVNQEKKKPTTK